MKKSVFLILCFCWASGMVCFAQGQTIQPDNKKEWKLVWKDEFNYKNRAALLKKWESQNGVDSRVTLFCSRWEDNVEVGNGVVRLVNRKEERVAKKPWTCGNIWTRRDFLYGYFECRYKYSAASGTNNSFWLMTRSSYLWPMEKSEATDPATGKRFEIDINEGHYPNKVNTCIHSRKTNADGSETLVASDSKPVEHVFDDIDFSKDYHLFGLEWTKDEIIYYLDRKEIRREKNVFCLTPSPILLSVAIKDWAGKVADSIDGTYMEIDYVRVYNRK